jgi:deoxyribose-phosphate aldolase
MDKLNLASYIDHTALKPETTPQQIEQLCREALEYNFASVCVNPIYIPLVTKVLSNSNVKPCTVVGFPLGAAAFANKQEETKLAIAQGAREIDMVLWIGGLKAGQDSEVERDISNLAKICRNENAILKVIFETCLLTQEEKSRACKLCVNAGAHFVKTSTGFSSGGATLEDVKLMAELVKPAGLEVKASGGIRSYDDAMKMIEAGATRLGTSSGVKIVKEAK